MSDKEQIIQRSVIITGIPGSVDVEDFIETLVAKHNVKKPTCVAPRSDSEGGGYTVLIHPMTKSVARKQLFFVNEYQYQGKTYQISLKACAEEDVPEAWLDDPPNFTSIQTNTKYSSSSNTNTNSKQRPDAGMTDQPDHDNSASPERAFQSPHGTGGSVPVTSSGYQHSESQSTVAFSSQEEPGTVRPGDQSQDCACSPDNTAGQHVPLPVLNTGYQSRGQPEPSYKIPAQKPMPHLQPPQHNMRMATDNQRYPYAQMPTVQQHGYGYHYQRQPNPSRYPPNFIPGITQQGYHYPEHAPGMGMYGPRGPQVGFQQQFQGPGPVGFSQEFVQPGLSHQFSHLNNPQGGLPTPAPVRMPVHEARRYPAQEPVQNMQVQSQSLATEVDDKEDSPRVIKVTGLPPNTSEDAIVLYFENRRRSGGGGVERVELVKKNNLALVYFEESNAAERVLNQSSHLINKERVQVSAHVERSAEAHADTESDEDEPESCTIEVRGFKPGTSNETIEMYFENTRRSGGETVTGLERKDDVIYVTFATSEEVKRVLEKKHEVEHKKLQVKLHIPKPCYKNRFLVTNLKNTTTKDGLWNYLEARSRCDVTNIDYGEHPGIALVTFDSETIPDLDKLKQQFKTKPLQGKVVEISSVPIADSVVVQCFGPETSEETISYYFESKRSGNKAGSEVMVTIHSEQAFCIVRFDDHKVVDEVLSKSTHKIEGFELSVSLYMECLGISRSDDDQSWYRQPEAFTMESLNKYKCRFLQDKKDQNLKRELSTCFAEITWLSDDSATLKCSLTKDSPDAVKKARTWRKDAENCMTTSLDQIVVEEINPLSQIWDDVQSKLKAINSSNKDSRMIISTTEPKVVIVGYASAVTQLANEVKSVVEAVEDEFNKKRQEVTETVSSLKPIQLRLLLATGFHKQMIRDHNDLDVVIRLKQNDLVLKGQVKDITSCKLKMYETITSYHAKEVSGFSEVQLSFLEQREVKDTIVNKMKGNNLYGVWETESVVLSILSTSEGDALDVARMIQEVVVEHTETLEPESASLLSSEKWRRLVEDIKTTHGNIVKIVSNLESNNITVVATHSIAHGIRAKIQEFIADNSIFSRTVKIPKPVYKFLMMHGENEIKRTSENINKYNGKIDYKPDEPRINIRGCKEGLTEAVTRLTNIAKNVVNRKYTMQKAGIGKYIHSDKIKGAISDTEKSERCVIELAYDESERIKVEGGSHPVERPYAPAVHSGSTMSGVSHIASCVIDSGRRIDVVMGDMTTMNVDVIVNAANNRLDHIGGLAKAIAVKGGPTIQRESDEYIAKHKSVRAGDAVPTGAGRLPCRMVVHAVGPVWSGGRQGEERDLKDAVMGSMECADRKGFKSIVLPALSSGIFGYPTHLATRHIVEAVEIFYRLESPNSGLTNVYLVDVSPASVNHFIAALKDVFPQKKVTMSADTASAPANTSSPPPVALKPKPGGRAHRVFSSEESSKPLGVINIKVVKGEIAKQKVDVIVNTTSNNLELTNGAVSKSILKAGGQSIQDELRGKYRSGIQPGDIAVSSGGDLQCQDVYHTCLSSWTNDRSKWGNSIDALKNLVHACLSKASDSRYTSIAFPALGTGNLGFPIDVVAQTMFAAVRDFQKRNTTLNQVLFVIYHMDRDIIKEFEKCDKQVDTGKSFDPPRFITRQSRILQEEEENEEMYTTQGPTSSAGDTFKIDLVEGEINKQKADVIVNSASNNLDLNSGAVAKSLLKTGGDILQQELRANYSQGLQAGEIAVTSGGKLQCTEVYHICLPNWSTSSSEKFLKDVIHSCLRKASDAGYKSVAFPALGTGNLGYPKEVVATTMFSAMANFQQRNKSLEKVKIVIYHKDTPVIEAFKACQEQRKSGGGITRPRPAPRPAPRRSLAEYEETGSSDDNKGIYIGCLSIEIKQGDITQENADCIVNSTNPELDLKRGGVSSSIAKTCGKDMYDQCLKKAADMRKKGVISTRATGLNCKYVIHVAGDHFGNDWKAVILACLNEAETLGDVQSVAFPVLGTGAGHVNPEEMALIMAQALNQFESQAVKVNDVRVVVFQKYMMHPFTYQMKNSASKIEKPMRSMLHTARVSPGSVDLYFFSDDNKNIDRGIINLERKCGKELKSRDVTDEVITKLTDDQIRKLKETFDVDLVVDRKKGRVVMTGLAAEVGDALVEVTTYLRKIEKQEGEAERATLLSRSVQWSYFETKAVKMNDFDTISNALIEKEFESKIKKCKVKLQTGEFKINFNSMQGYLNGKKDVVFNVIRRDLFEEASASIFDPPKTWQQMAGDDNFVACDVANTDPEFTEVAQLFMKTVGVPTAKVLNVRRIQNRALYQQYMAKKEQLDKQNPQGTQNERRLWHGTSTDAIDSINNHGYNRSYCGKNATAFGQGVYFAVNANYSASDTYSRPDNLGQKYMYLAKVLSGVYVNGHHSMRIPPAKPGGKGTHDLCDSVVNDSNAPIMFVVFNDTQAYPEYLVTFKLQ